MYNPIELSKKIENIVCTEDKKKYYRFRPAGFYGGIATADAVGCNLRCKFCWSTKSVWKPTITGESYSPEEVSETLLDIAKTKDYHKIRISGGEPTIGRRHLIKVLELIHPDLLFILETNGILLGYDKKYIEDLSKFNNLHIRVCIKGINPEEFTLLTGAEVGYEYQMKSLEYLKDLKTDFNIALVSISKDKSEFYMELAEMGLGKLMLEEEEIKLYPQVKNRLEKEGLIKYINS
jgi:uncharacterized Fe-S cluster-containing radical SAM superfamily protein